MSNATPTNLSYEGKVALVTGAGQGIGLATAQAFAAAGAAVVMADVNEAAARSAAEQLLAAGHKAMAVRCDVADEAQVKAMLDKTVSTFGRLDAAFNNAGVQTPPVETADSSGDEFNRTIAINLRGVWSCMKYELRQMRAQGSGAIVNCSSLGGLVGLPGRASSSVMRLRSMAGTRRTNRDHGSGDGDDENASASGGVGLLDTCSLRPSAEDNSAAKTRWFSSGANARRRSGSFARARAIHARSASRRPVEASRPVAAGSQHRDSVGVDRAKSGGRVAVPFESRARQWREARRDLRDHHASRVLLRLGECHAGRSDCERRLRQARNHIESASTSDG